MILNIVLNPNPFLRQVAKEININELTKGQYKKIIADMSETMLIKDGIGLAAPQINLSERLIVVNTKNGVLAMVNPIISRSSLTKDWDEEGCLSIPHTFGKVKRYRAIRCDFFTSEGKKQRIEAKGLLARVIQHEIDHLNGILFIDKAKDINVNTYNL